MGILAGKREGIWARVPRKFGHRIEQALGEQSDNLSDVCMVKGNVIQCKTKQSARQRLKSLRRLERLAYENNKRLEMMLSLIWKMKRTQSLMILELEAIKYQQWVL